MRRGASTPIALIIGTIEIFDVRVALIEVVMQIVSAVGTDKQTGEHIGFSFIRFPLTDFTPLLLHLFPDGTVNNRIMHVLKDNPIVTVVLNSFLILIGFAVRLEIQDISTILLQGKNLCDGRTVPLCGCGIFMLAGAVDTSCLPIRHWRQNAVLFQRGGNLFCSKAVYRHSIDTADYSGSFLIYYPALWIFRIFNIAIRRLAHRLPGVSFDLVADTPFLADIAGVPLVEHALFGKVKTKRKKLSIHAGLRRSGSRPNPLSNLKKPAE